MSEEIGRELNKKLIEVFWNRPQEAAGLITRIVENPYFAALDFATKEGREGLGNTLEEASIRYGILVGYYYRKVEEENE